MSNKKFPEEILVTWEEPSNDDPYMTVNQKIEEVAVIGEKVRVAVYKLDCVTEVTCEVRAK